VRDAPIASRASKKAHERSHHRSAAIIRHSLRDGFTVSFVLAPETGFVVSVAGAMRRHCHQLDISVGISGPHDFAVRIGASRQHAPIRPSHSTPNVRDDREAPLLLGRETGRAGSRDLPDGASGSFGDYGSPPRPPSLHRVTWRDETPRRPVMASLCRGLRSKDESRARSSNQ
jgi:hypothetical protein